MLFTSKTNTNATVNTAEATQETENHGGLLKGLAIGIGTVAGIGLAAFGGKKAYDHFHVKDENRLDNVDVTDNEFIEEVTEEPATVETFNEVETEEPVDETPVEAEEAKTEETKNETTAEDKKPSATKLVDKLEKEASLFSNDVISPIEIKMAIEQMDFIMGRIAQCYRTIGDNARIGAAVRKLQNGVKDFWLGMNHEILTQKFHPENLEDLFANDIDLIDNAYFEMKYINKSDLVLGVKDSTVEMYNRLVRLADKQASNETQVDVKSARETQIAEPVVDETQATTKEVSDEIKTVISKCEERHRTSIDNAINDLSKYVNPCNCDAEDIAIDIMRSIGICDRHIRRLTLMRISSVNEIVTIVNRHASLTIDSIVNASVNRINNTTDDVYHELGATLVALKYISSSIDKLHDVQIYQKTLDRLNNVINDMTDRRKAIRAERRKSVDEKLATVKKASDETKAEVKKVVDENQATTKEEPSETQIGNSKVISDDGETVTLKASVSEDSVQNVMDVIDIISKIPNKEDSEKNDMPYFIRVIGGKIAGITEPEATFLAYNAETKSNDFIDACVSLCNMVGNGICNLADQKSNPISSIGWINRSYDELIASGVIDNTYTPQSMRYALTQARNEAVRVLSNMIKPEDMEDHIVEKTSDETQAEETAATVEPETAELPVDVTSEVNELTEKIKQACQLLKDNKPQEAKEYYKTNLTPYLVDDNLSKETRNAIESINTRATNMMMSEKQQAAKAAKAAAKANKKSKKNSRRNRR